jgi:hypothetical protein
MTSKLVTELVLREGLLPLLTSREGGQRPALADVERIVDGCEILALGAAADTARRRECSDEVRIHVPFAPASNAEVLVLGPAVTLRGTALLRHVAKERLLGPIGRRIVVDFGALGLEIAQVALSFGATDLAGPIASRRGLAMIDDDPKKVVKRREIAGYVERAGFRPVFVTTEARSDAAPATTDAPARPHVDS